MSAILSKPFPNLSTERLQLRSISEDDLHDLFLLRSNEHVGKYLDRMAAKNMDDVKRFIQATLEGIEQNNRLYWAICLKQNGALAGTVCLWNISNDGTTAEVGYELFPAFQGLGIMHEALSSVITYCFNSLHFERLEAYTHLDNFSSSRLLEKCLFKPEAGKNAPENIKLQLYTLHRANWKQ